MFICVIYFSKGKHVVNCTCNIIHVTLIRYALVHILLFTIYNLFFADHCCNLIQNKVKWTRLSLGYTYCVIKYDAQQTTDGKW